ncbi:MAG TPA: type II toxin-antitoxin system RelE/ParE family toxin [Streptosporangiaceae bacterium]
MRILFIFDPVRNVVLLVAGDKSDRWKEWYAEAIPAAEAAYEAYLEGQCERAARVFHLHP